MSSPTDTRIIAILNDLEATAGSGYALALHIRFTSPAILMQTYSKAWTDYYSQNGLVMSDPTVAWGFDNLGTRRWSDLAELDTAGVMAMAADHGLVFGATSAVERDGSRSIGSLARADREFTEAEITGFHAALRDLHDLTTDPDALSDAAVKKIRSMAVRLTRTEA